MADPIQKIATAKQMLYGRYHKSEDDRATFAKKAAYKAADLALDDDVNITNTKTGIGTAGAIGIGAVAGLPGLITALALAFGGSDAQPAQTNPEVLPVQSEFDVLFYDKDGNPISVPRRQSK